MNEGLTRHALLAIVLCALGATAAGCSYCRHRADDAAEMIDLGVTVTDSPQVGLYWNSLDLFPVGYSHLDGWVAGVAGGQVGITRHYNRCWGFGYAREEMGWEEFDPADEDTLHVRYSGVLGMALPPYRYDPAYTPACVHVFPHIAYVGLMWNARYYEMLDFVVGFTTIDLAGDDGRDMGHWPWQEPPAARSQAVR